MKPTEFIRSMPMTISADELMALAEKEGVSGVNRGLIHQTRSLERRKGKAMETDETLTLKEKIYQFCAGHIQEHGEGPKIGTIKAAVGGRSEGGISSTLKILKAEGKLSWEPGNYTSMRVVNGSNGKSNGKSRKPKATRAAPGTASEKLEKFLRGFVAKHHRGPTTPEITSGVGLSGGAVAKNLRRLQAKGLIDYEPKDYHSIRFTEASSLPAAAPPPALPPGPVAYLAHLKTDLTLRIGSIALKEDPELDMKRKAVSVVIAMLEEKAL